MQSMKLLAGTVIFSIIYLLIGPRDLDANFPYLVFIEACLFSLIICASHTIQRKKIILIFPILAGLINLILFAVWPFILAVPSLIIEAFDFSVAVNSMIGFALYSAIGSIAFCALVDLMIQPNYFSYKAYVYTAVLSLTAGIPFLIFENHFLVIHKIIWFCSFSAGLVLAEQHKEPEPMSLIKDN
ncbi:hypothetical protein [Thalassotalea mangrovi]|uniref:Uncharacterized protein n=1 Tax=Thalassotalea mangrovi TaxID=2572245 RepID=A0A4U1B2R4_9GAMM|nr:hypothetical protein [Thalassotalea mangrovi]TKB43562.1 hypothetical protein E8M12_14810 [Thalassotalea mangrovi]